MRLVNIHKAFYVFIRCARPDNRHWHQAAHVMYVYLCLLAVCVDIFFYIFDSNFVILTFESSHVCYDAPTHIHTNAAFIHSIGLFDVCFSSFFFSCNFAYVCVIFSNITFELHLQRLFGMWCGAQHTPNVDFVCANDDLLEYS